MKLAAACAALATLALAAACSRETIVLATVDEDAGMSSHHAARCFKNADCTRSDFCAIDKDGDGRCFPRPLSCDTATNGQEFEPVCGMSGITYFNDCHRKQAGEGTATDGECDDTALRCDVAAPCPVGSVCALVSFEDDLPDAPTCGRALGTCWGILKCPTAGPGARFDECVSKGSPPGEHCLDICNAVQTGKPFTATHEQCNGK